MKVLNISLEKKLFAPDSKPLRRVIDYAKMFERFDLVVLTPSGNKKIDFENMRVLPTNSPGKFFYFFNAYSVGKNIVKEFNHDVISAQDPFETGLIAFLLARKFKKKLQIQIHGDYFGSSNWKNESCSNFFKYFFAKFIVRRADGVRVVSRRTRESLIDIGIPQHKIYIAPIYAETGAVSEVMNKLEGKFIFLTAGRLAKVKNIGMQIEALKEVTEEFPRAELWILGDGPERSLLENKSRELKLDNNVKFLGWKEKLSPYYASADTFLLTSNYEGWGLVVIEAAAHGLPVIMTDVGCAGEVIKNGESGIIIKTGDKKALTESMKRLIRDEELRRKLGEAAKEAVSKLPDEKESLGLFADSFKILER